MLILYALLALVVAVSRGEDWQKTSSPFEKKIGNMTVRFIPVGMGYSSSSVNIFVFGKPILSHKEWQFIGYWNDEGYLTLGKRLHNTTVWEIEVTQYKGKGIKDGHNHVSVGLDGDDFLHVSFDHHGHPLHYVKSIAPLSLKVGEMIPMVGKNEGRVSYPQFFLLPNGDMLFAYRDGSSGDGNIVLNRYITKEKKWIRVHDIFVSGRDKGHRNAYWEFYMDVNWTLHCTWTWRDTGWISTNHDICYARSRDEGQTWETIDGRVYTLPITLTTADYVQHIPVNSSLMNGFGLTTDNSGNVFLGSFWAMGDGIAQHRMLFRDHGEWKLQNLSQLITPYAMYIPATLLQPLDAPRLFVHDEGDRRKVYYAATNMEDGLVLGVSEDLSQDKWVRYSLNERNGRGGAMDVEAWRSRHQLHILFQHVTQGIWERPTPVVPRMVYVLEVDGL
jgi:hypothetical protein